MPRERISIIFFFAVFLFFLHEAAQILEPFLSPLTCALAVAIVCYPAHRGIARRLKKSSPTFRAFLSDLAVFLFIVVPIGLVVTALIFQIQSAIPEVREHSGQWLQSVKDFSAKYHPAWISHLPFGMADKLDLSSPDVHAKVQDYIDSLSAGVGYWAAAAARHVARFLFDLLLFQFVLFFLFRDGEDLYAQWNDLLPLSPAYKTRLHKQIGGTVEGVVRGAIVVGLIQGVIATLGYVIVGLDAAILLGSLTAFASILPGIGTIIMWALVFFYFLAAGMIWKAVVIFVFGCVAAIADNVVRPYVVGNKTEISFLWLSLSILGGLEIFGLMGLLIGPLVFALLPILFDIYKEYIHERQKVHE